MITDSRGHEAHQAFGHCPDVAVRILWLLRPPSSRCAMPHIRENYCCPPEKS